jgi:hypothetical protein
MERPSVLGNAAAISWGTPLRLCYRWAHHPFRPGGSDDSLHRASRFHHATRRRGGGMAARGAALKTESPGHLNNMHAIREEILVR